MESHWLVGFLFGISFYIGVKAIPITLFNPQVTLFPTIIRPDFNNIWSLIGGAGLLFFWMGSAISWSRQRRRRRLLDIQTGLASIRALSWQDFERLVAEAYRRHGYRVRETGGGGADGGVDLLLFKGGKTIMVQCKQWRTKSVSAPTVREMWGLVAHHGYHGVKIVTVGGFTPEAQAFAKGKPMELVSGEDLVRLIERVHPSKSGLDLSPGAVRVLPKASKKAHFSKDCPECGRSMVKRYNRSNGEAFLGCSAYPSCKGTRQL